MKLVNNIPFDQDREDSILQKACRRWVMQRAGLDPLTRDERAEYNRRIERAKKAFSRMESFKRQVEK